jgi:LPXTG-motif cell wall-anchored protein
MTRPSSAQRRRQAFAAAIAALGVLAVPAVAHANRVDTAAADCTGFRFDMPRAETGTIVTATRNGQPAMDPITVTVFGAAVRFFLPSPDRTVAQSWRVEVDGPNGDQVFIDSEGPCVAPTTTAPTSTSSTSTTTTVPPVVASSAPAPTSTTSTIASTSTTSSVPPVAEPRPSSPPAATPAEPAPTGLLPATGGSPSALTISLASIAVLTGAGLVFVRRRVS